MVPLVIFICIGFLVFVEVDFLSHKNLLFACPEELVHLDADLPQINESGSIEDIYNCAALCQKLNEILLQEFGSWEFGRIHHKRINRCTT